VGSLVLFKGFVVSSVLLISYGSILDSDCFEEASASLVDLSHTHFIDIHDNF
jgi:hypothetical protein